MAHDCPLCPARVRPGQRVGLDFESNLWGHLGCLVRKVHAANRVADLANLEHFGDV